MDEEPVLLHEANLMLAILRAANGMSAGLEDAAARLRANLALAGEPAPHDPADLWRRLEQALALLEQAGAVAVIGERGFRSTALGSRLLAEHPEGVDETVLWAVGAGSRTTERHAQDDPRLPAYTAGLLAFADGRSLVANPHAADTPDHLAWENGWSEARDNAKDAEPPLVPHALATRR